MPPIQKEKKGARGKKICRVVITVEVLKDHPYPSLFALCYNFWEFSTLNLKHLQKFTYCKEFC